MSTPTPRTDAVRYTPWNEEQPVVSADFARTLECELAAERARLDWLEKRRAALNAHCGSTYGWEVVQSHLVNRLMLRTPEVSAMAGVDVNDACAGGKDIRAAIDAAMKEETK